MSKTGTTRVTVKPGEAPSRGETDWARVNATTDEEVLAAALSDPDAQPLDPEALAKMRRRRNRPNGPGEPSPGMRPKADSLGHDPPQARGL
jgi:hypothetical protein